MSPENDEGRPPAGTALRVENPDGGFDASTVRQDADRPRAKQRYPVAYVSLYAPAGRRRRWWAAYVCAHCGGGHFARLHAEADANGIRRTGCGRMVWLVVARTYHGKKAVA